MHPRSLVLALSLSFAVLSAQAAPRAQKPVRVIRGAFEMVVCLSEGRLNVRGDNLHRVLFSVSNHEPLKVFQGWGDNKKQFEVNGDEYTFVKVQFTNRESRGQSSVGWVAESHVKPRSECPGAGGDEVQPPKDGEEEQDQPAPVKPEPKKPGKPQQPPQKPSRPQPPREDEDEEQGNGRGQSGGSGEIRGLNDPNCCQFPVQGRVTTDFNDGMRRFGAGRSDGRLHAACDLYRYTGEAISAVAPGRVIRDKYFFYKGTYAIEVRHSGGFVVRYGEVLGKNAASVGSGSSVKMGQTIAYMGKVNSNCCEPMLHFELYSGSASGPLSTGSGPYQRRSDLLNPTKYLRQWESHR